MQDQLVIVVAAFIIIISKCLYFWFQGGLDPGHQALELLVLDNGAKVGSQFALSIVTALTKSYCFCV